MLLATGRFSAWFGDDSPPPETVEIDAEQNAVSEPRAAPIRPPARNTVEPKPETTTVTFQEFSEQYSALRENFRARDSLTALVVDKQIQWEGYVRNVTRHSTAFYVSVAATARGYSGPSASITFDHAMEDELYALRPEDRVRFEGVVTRAAGSVGVEGLEIQVIE